MGWIGVDLDGTLAVYDGWRGEGHIGEPIPKMVERVKKWLESDMEVRIFTARASLFGRSPEARDENVRLVQEWCGEHLGKRLRVTSDKDMQMIMLWDDKAMGVIPNTGMSVEEFFHAKIEKIRG